MKLDARIHKILIARLNLFPMWIFHERYYLNLIKESAGTYKTKTTWLMKLAIATTVGYIT